MVGVLNTANHNFADSILKQYRVFFLVLHAQGIPENRRKARIKDMCVQWLNNWLGQFRQHIRSLAGKISRAQAGSVVKYV